MMRRPSARWSAGLSGCRSGSLWCEPMSRVVRHPIAGVSQRSGAVVYRPIVGGRRVGRQPKLSSRMRLFDVGSGASRDSLAGSCSSSGLDSVECRRVRVVSKNTRKCEVVSVTLLDVATGVPPVGRRRATITEIEAAFVSAPEFSASTTRRTIWADFETGLQLLSSAVLVHAAWLGGSFISSKLDPSDLDVVFLVNQSDLNRRSDPEKQIVDAFLRWEDQGPGRPARAHGLLIDSFILNWRPLANPNPDAPGHAPYVKWRGYWDDFWCRNRSGSKSDPPTREDALPRRGYVEVIIDDYRC